MSITWENTAETQEFSADPIINRKIKTAAAGLQKSIQNYFLEFPTERDKEVVADFMLACSQQENVAIKTKRVYLIALTYLSRFLENKKSFDTITAKEFSAFLNRMYKDQTQDPNQSWISTQRTLGLALLKFFKWLAYPDLTPQERKRLPREHWPPVLKGFMLQRKKGALLQTPVTQKDIWDDKDVTVFLKYCSGDNPRLAFYHALAYESSARPGELLQLKIGDIADNIQTDEGDRLCAFVDVGRYGKKKQSRIVGITEFTIQYFQKFLTASSKDHPDPTNKKAFLFLSREHSAMSRNIPISNDTLRSDYVSFRDEKIPRLLKRPDVTEGDKKHLEFLRDTKKWYPYIMRHSSISKLAHEVED
jgi:site-specific recombinase XerD